MSAPSIVSREHIALQAARAAQIAHHTGGKPENPWCPSADPEHHAQWEASFAREMHALCELEDTEGSA